MFKILKGMAPDSLTHLLVKKQDITEYNLRGSSTLLQLPLPKTENGKRSQFLHLAAILILIYMYVCVCVYIYVYIFYYL